MNCFNIIMLLSGFSCGIVSVVLYYYWSRKNQSSEDYWWKR